MLLKYNFKLMSKFAISQNSYFYSTRHFLLLIGAILLDQVTKTWASSMGGAGSFGAAGQMILEQGNLNKGISFGLFSSFPSWLVIMVSIGILALLHNAFLSLWKKYPYVAMLFFAGGLSNAIDRVVLGGVRDWLPIPFIGLYNNVADWYIAIAVILIATSEVWEVVTQKSDVEKHTTK